MRVLITTLLFVSISTHAKHLNLSQFYNNPAQVYYESPKKDFPGIKRPGQQRLSHSQQKSAPHSNDRVERLFPFDRVEKDLAAIDSMNLK